MPNLEVLISLQDLITLGSIYSFQKHIEENIHVINHPLEPKIVWLEEWEEQELFSDRLDKGF